MPPRVKTAVWPEDAPNRFEENIISISAGNSNLNWALHTGFNFGFVPILFWRTPPVLRDEQNSDDACTVLARHLPRQVHSIIFGTESADHHKEIATKVASKRRSPAMSIYIVSTNQENENGILFLFKDIPSRVFRLQPHHFFTREEGAYETIGVDRVTTLYSCKKTHPDRHVLCFDAGTAWTYTLLNHKGNIVGGGIAPGVGARFRSLADYCEGLPDIDHRDYHSALKGKLEKGESFPVFAEDTKNAMMASTFSEIGNQARYLIKHFLEVVKADGEAASKHRPVVVVAGGDAPFMVKMLRKDFSGIIRNEPGTAMPSDQFELEEAKHLVHYGVGQCLCNNIAPEASNPDDKLREALKGNRVAKRFATPNYDGTDVFRGSVMSIKSGAKVEDDLFFIRYDDGDSEHMEFSNVYDALQLYLEVGEAQGGEKLKLDQINKSVTAMEDKDGTLRDDATKRKENREGELVKQKNTEIAKRQAQSAKRAGRSAKGGPPKKKSKTSKDEDKRTKYIGKRIAKAFEGPTGGSEIYFGTVDKVTQPKEPFYWHVVYDDDDEEEFDETDIIKALMLYQNYKKSDTGGGERDKNDESSLVNHVSEAAVTSNKGGGGGGANKQKATTEDVAAPEAPPPAAVAAPTAATAAPQAVAASSK